MSDAEYVPPARPVGDRAWEADFERANGHRMQVLSRPESQPESR